MSAVFQTCPGGSTLNTVLPRRRPRPVIGGSGPAACLGQKGPALRYSILIVDDNPVIRRTLRTCLLERGDWKICGEAGNGQEAVEKAQQLKPDLIILDLSMPVMNGLQAARELKRISPTVQVLMFTSFKSPNLEKEAVASGCTAVIEKSDLRELFSNVHRLLPKAG